MFLLAPAHPGCPGQNPQSRKMVVYVCALTLLVECQEGHRDSKKLNGGVPTDNHTNKAPFTQKNTEKPKTKLTNKTVRIAHVCAYVFEARCRFAYGPADDTATHYLIAPVNPDWFYLPGFTFLVTGSPG